MTKSILVCTIFVLAFAGRTVATDTDPRGMISGTISVADKENIRSAPVKARDTINRITYTVFTRKGRYHVSNLPPSSYEIMAAAEGFESPVKKVKLKPGEKKTVDLTLQAREVAPSNVDLVDFDTLYPPGRTRDLMGNHCFGCHTKQQFPKWRLPPPAWAFAVEKMTTTLSPASKAGEPMVTGLSSKDKQAIVDYLTVNFGPDTPRRNLKVDELQPNEDDLAKAMYIQWDLPEPPDTGRGRKRGLHDPFVAPDGTIFYNDTTANTIFRIDPHELDFEKRFEEWPIKSSEWVYSHGITLDSGGNLYWSEIVGGHVGELNPDTGEQRRYRMPSKGGALQVVTDSKDNIWYALYMGNRIGKLEAKTKEISDWKIPSPGGNIYGFVVDQKDRLWGAEMQVGKIIKFDPASETFTEYATPTQPSGVRRLSIDSKGHVWVSYHFAGKVGRFDPESEKWLEYQFPLRHTQPYDCWPDAQDNIWCSDTTYSSMVKLEPQSERFTYYPWPHGEEKSLPIVDENGVPKIEIDQEGTLWINTRNPLNVTATALKPKGNSVQDAVADGRQ